MVALGSGVAERRGDRGGVGDRPRHGHRAVGGVVAGVAAGVVRRQRDRRRPPARARPGPGAAAPAGPPSRFGRARRRTPRADCDTASRELNDHNSDRGHIGVPRVGAIAGWTGALGPGGSMITSHTGTAAAAPREPDPLPLHRGDRRGRASASLVGLVAPDFAVELKPLGTGFVALIKMMIQPVIFCTIVLGVGSVRQRRPGRQGRRPRARLLPHHVDGRARHRPRRRQPHQARRRAAPRRRRRERRPGAGRGGPRQHHRVPARDHPRLDALRADQRRGAADPAGRAARRLRAAGDGRGRQAGPARRRRTSSGSCSGCWR